MNKSHFIQTHAIFNQPWAEEGEQNKWWSTILPEVELFSGILLQLSLLSQQINNKKECFEAQWAWNISTILNHLTYWNDISIHLSFSGIYPTDETTFFEKVS